MSDVFYLVAGVGIIIFAWPYAKAWYSRRTLAHISRKATVRDLQLVMLDMCVHSMMHGENYHHRQCKKIIARELSRRHAAEARPVAGKL